MINVYNSLQVFVQIVINFLSLSLSTPLQQQDESVKTIANQAIIT